jgi:hypothetical protein
LRPAFELAQIIERFGSQFADKYQPNGYILRTLGAIRSCRTSSLGGHVDRCCSCGHIRVSYNSCRNRHCPKCQNTQREAWIEDRKQDLLTVPYFHVVFTVPDKLNPLFLADSPAMYNLLFRAVWQTMQQFFCTRLNAEGGMITVLHTWGQSLSLHPHIHCIVPGGGIDWKGRWKGVPVSENGKVFLFPVKALSKVFRGKLTASLHQSYPTKKERIKASRDHEWVVYTKEPFAGPSSVVEYPGRYTHKIAISNHRLLNIDDQGVTFRWRDYRDLLNFDPDQCPHCKTGKMVLLERFIPGRGPPHFHQPNSQKQ